MHGFKLRLKPICGSDEPDFDRNRGFVDCLDVFFATSKGVGKTL